MNVAVLGLWHLGSVTAACLAAAGHSVRGFDPDPGRIAGLAAGRPPIAEPGLAELIAAALQSGALRFTADLAEAVVGADVVWVTFDTPVDDEDRADVSSVIRSVERAFPYLGDGAIILSSSQLPAGTTRGFEETWSSQAAGRSVSFACSPENLRLGKAIETFTKPDRVVVGVREARARNRIAELLAPITDRIEWMSVESAEMTKHAINAFLATSVTFANEIAALCECVGADAKEVERGLRTERRIGALAYVAPGGAFAGGTLARDVAFLRELGTSSDRPTLLMSYARQHLQEAARIIDSIDADAIERIAEILLKARNAGGRLFFLGVGGSAGNCSHAVNDFRKLAGFEAYAPTDNVSELTARTNDEGWETVFAAWLAGSRLRSEDAVFVFSVGGGSLEKNISANLVRALQYARHVGAAIVGVVGRDGGYTADVADACVIVPTVNPETVTPHSEAFQAVVWHLLVSHPSLKLVATKWESTR